MGTRVSEERPVLVATLALDGELSHSKVSEHSKSCSVRHESDDVRELGMASEATVIRSDVFSGKQIVK